MQTLIIVIAVVGMAVNTYSFLRERNWTAVYGFLMCAIALLSNI